VSRLISPQAAFDRLRPYLKGDGWITGTMLNAEMYRGFLPLYCNGVLLNPTEIGDLQLYVRAEMARNGRFTCTIESRLPRRGRVIEVDDTQEVQTVVVEYPPPPRWEVEAEAIEKLLQRTREGHQPEWLVQTAEEIRYLALIHSELLENSSALYQHIENHLSGLGLSWDKNRSRFRKAIDEFTVKYR
jgi:hypothetical protein